eukprot:Rhum_TRINITY_DN14731_c14_g1::Rhum_TRINITY_DN14731_c14_g1_i1::g.115409::m.115409
MAIASLPPLLPDAVSERKVDGDRVKVKLPTQSGAGGPELHDSRLHEVARIVPLPRAQRVVHLPTVLVERRDRVVLWHDARRVPVYVRHAADAELPVGQADAGRVEGDAPVADARADDHGDGAAHAVSGENDVDALGLPTLGVALYVLPVVREVLTLGDGAEQAVEEVLVAGRRGDGVDGQALRQHAEEGQEQRGGLVDADLDVHRDVLQVVEGRDGAGAADDDDGQVARRRVHVEEGGRVDALALRGVPEHPVTPLLLLQHAVVEAQRASEVPWRQVAHRREQRVRQRIHPVPLPPAQRRVPVGRQPLPVRRLRTAAGGGGSGGSRAAPPPPPPP